MKVESIAECSLWSMLQYFWAALSDNQSWKPIFGLFESGRFIQVLLYLHTASTPWVETGVKTMIFLSEKDQVAYQNEENEA